MYDCDLLIVARFFLCLLLRHFFSTLLVVLTSVALGGNTKYVLMGGKDAEELRINPLLTQNIREITYICCVERYFYKSEESSYFIRLLRMDGVLGADDGCKLGSLFIESTPFNTLTTR